jgi:hypothetical protein
MGRVVVSVRAGFPPERFVAALTDFGPGRSRIWGNSSPGSLKVHEVGDQWADVTEGTRSGGIWQRYHYDWSQPGLVRLDVVDSNAFGPGSYWEYRLIPDAAGGCEVHLIINRAPSTVRGKFFEPVLLLIGRPYFSRDLRRTVRRIEDAPAGRPPAVGG